jgi:hypothetical protein
MKMLTDSSVKSSAMYIGYLILKEVQRQSSEKVSIYDISKALKKSGVSSGRQLVLGLSFLYATDIVEFEEANIWIKR